MYRGLQPIFDKHCAILILGSFPSVISRKSCFYYANKQNKFWSIIGKILEGRDLRLESDEVKAQTLLQHHIALWDIVQTCNIEGSSDSKIEDYNVVNLNTILDIANIQKILFNGKKSAEIYFKHYKLNIPSVVLPSTSSANASASKTILDTYKINLLDI